jgi:hypothetical protein
MANWSLLIDCIDRGKQEANGAMYRDYIVTHDFYVPCAQASQILGSLKGARHNGCIKRKYPEEVVSVCRSIGWDECIKQSTRGGPCEYASGIISKELESLLGRVENI